MIRDITFTQKPLLVISIELNLLISQHLQTNKCSAAYFSITCKNREPYPRRFFFVAHLLHTSASSSTLYHNINSNNI